MIKYFSLQAKKKTGFLLLCLLVFPMISKASAFEDSMADVVSWVVLIVAPIVVIGLFLMVHVLPEKIAEKRNHPQAHAIKVLCILSLFFGGLLWPLAWLWAYTKPVLYKMAYGTDKGDYHEPTMEDLKASKETKSPTT
jgi:CBS domain containing-hemolysin-like protein